MLNSCLIQYFDCPRLQKERDELRAKNALLIGKTAELSRKQSFAGYGGTSPGPLRNGGR